MEPYKTETTHTEVILSGAGSSPRKHDATTAIYLNVSNHLFDNFPLPIDLLIYAIISDPVQTSSIAFRCAQQCHPTIKRS